MRISSSSGSPAEPGASVRPGAVKAVEGAAVLRNLAAHGREADLGEARALDYLALVDAVRFALGHQPLPPGGTS